METYRIMNDRHIQRQSDLAYIPPAEENLDYVQYLEDIGNGAEVLPFDYEAEALRQLKAAPTYEDLRRAEMPSGISSYFTGKKRKN